MRLNCKFLIRVLVVLIISINVTIVIFWKKTKISTNSTIKNTKPPIKEIYWHITEDGIYPLRKLDIQYNKWTKDSVIPKKFFRNIPGVSNHNFKWILNPYRSCVSSETNLVTVKLPEIFLLVAIASASWEFERRKLIRKTWISVRNPFNLKVKYLFFLGSGRTSIQKLNKEFEEFNDIVVESFQETYKNLTLKTQGQLKWATYFCPNARYVMHVDDDVFVDVKSIVESLIDWKEKRLLLCGKIFMPKVRREGKWEMSPEEYRGKQYPKSCVGWCFVMTHDVAHELYFTSTKTHLIHLEDVSFTGIVRKKIKDLELTKLKNGEKVCRHLGWPKDRETNEKLKEAWNELKQKEKKKYLNSEG